MPLTVAFRATQIVAAIVNQNPTSLNVNVLNGTEMMEPTPMSRIVKIFGMLYRLPSRTKAKMSTGRVTAPRKALRAPTLACATRYHARTMLVARSSELSTSLILWAQNICVVILLPARP
jgi:hypothetical protein